MKLSKSNLISLAMILALVALAFVGKQLSPLLLPKMDATGTADPGCNLQRQACMATLTGGARLQLSITPRPVAFLEPLKVEVLVTGVTPQNVEVDFSGETMNMGYNRIKLSPAGSISLAGETSLPVCVSGSMTWIATVIVETDRQRIAVPFRFSVGH